MWQEEVSHAAAATKYKRAKYDYDGGCDVKAQFGKKNYIHITEKQRMEAATK